MDRAFCGVVKNELNGAGCNMAQFADGCPDILLSAVERAKKNAAQHDDGMEYPDEFTDSIDAALNEPFGREHVLNRATGAVGWSRAAVTDTNSPVVLRLTTEEGGREGVSSITPLDFVTEILFVDTFDAPYPYNRRTMRRRIVQELGLELAEMGQRAGGRASGSKCLRFRGDVREALRDWLVEAEIAIDHPPSYVDPDGFARRDEKHHKHYFHRRSTNTRDGSKQIGRNPSAGNQSKRSRSRSHRKPRKLSMPADTEDDNTTPPDPLPTVQLCECESVREWLQARVDADSDRRVRALLRAASDGDAIEMARLLHVSSAGVDATDQHGRTPLMRVALKRYMDPKTKELAWQPLEPGYIETARQLLAKHADPNATDEHGYTALIHAACDNQMDLVIALLQHGANPDAKTALGYTALMEAAALNFCELCRLLLDHGAAVNAQDNEQKTALMRAAARGQGDVVQLLIGYGADRLVLDHFGVDARTMAIQNGHRETAELLAV